MSGRIAPSPSGGLLTGHLHRLRSDVLGLMMDGVRECGDVVRFRVGPLVMYLVNHPDHIAQVLIRNRANYDKASRSSAALGLICGESLLTANGPRWQQRRKLIQPMFHRAVVAGFIETMATCTRELMEDWEHRAAAGEEIEAASEMMHLTFRIVGRCLFGAELEEEAAAVDEAMKVLVTYTYDRWRSILNPPFSWPSPANLRFRRALADVDAIVAKLIARQRSNPPERPNLLSMLVASQDAESGLVLTDEEVRNEAIAFLLAGHETTATALAWSLHLLEQNPQWQTVLRDEFSAVCGERLPGMAELGQLTNALHVFEESIRLYPPIWAMERHAIAEDEIGGFRIPAGSGVIVSPYTLHRHPAYWDAPEEFRPCRFEQRDHPAYLPFGAGPRFCIGSEFALAEARVILPMIVSRFDFETVPGQVIEPEPAITLRMKHGLRLSLKAR